MPPCDASSGARVALRVPRLLALARRMTALVFVGFALFVARDFLRRHPEDAPWAPLDLNAPVGWTTAAKLDRLRDRPAECRALLTAAGVRFTAEPLRRDGPACSLAGTLRVIDPGVPLQPGGLALSCPLAAALTVWTRQVVVPAARGAGTRATAITDFGSYNCRTIAGSDRPSEHATANAIDVSGVRLADGTAVSIARDWRSPGRRGALARRLRDGACRLFAVTLSPDYNAAHHDHLHLDMGHGRVCG